MLLLPRHICCACRHLEREAQEADQEMARAYTQFLQAFEVSAAAGWPLVARLAGLGAWGSQPRQEGRPKVWVGVGAHATVPP